MSLKLVAIVCVRNEQMHIEACIRSLLDEGLSIALLDHGSTDDTVNIARQFLGAGVLTIQPLEWSGNFSLDAQVRAKVALMATLSYDWVISVDADEWLQAPAEFATLREGIEHATALGYNCINFDEFVFLPARGEDFEVPDYRRRMRRYYFFEPRPMRLPRAWSREVSPLGPEDCVHQTSGVSIRMYPQNFILRHYIVLSHQQAVGKYVGRNFAQEDLQRGWHANRLQLDERKLALPETDVLLELSSPDDRGFLRHAPRDKHFWQS
jgi:hypothetical protein